MMLVPEEKFKLLSLKNNEHFRENEAKQISSSFEETEKQGLGEKLGQKQTQETKNFNQEVREKMSQPEIKPDIDVPQSSAPKPKQNAEIDSFLRKVLTQKKKKKLVVNQRTAHIGIEY